jgi:hypothetical protein
MSPEGVVTGSAGGGTGADGDMKYDVQQPTEAEHEKWLKIGTFTDDPNEVAFHLSAAAALTAGLGPVNMPAGDMVSTNDLPKWLDMIGSY